MKEFTTALLFFAVPVLFQCCEAKAQDVTPQVAYVNHFLRNYPGRKARVVKAMPIIEKYAAKHGIDPLLPIIIASLESSYKTTARGEMGEYGWFQVMPKSVCSKGFDLASLDGQIAAGINCIVMSRDACDGSLKQTLTMYASGRCKSKSARTRRVIKWRIRIYEKWRK